jgi:hypothetical protein
MNHRIALAMKDTIGNYPVAIRITFNAPQERDAIHREYPLAYAFHDH